MKGDTKNSSSVISLVQDIAANNLILLFLFVVAIVIDGILVALISTAIMPVADYFLDPSFVKVSGVTRVYIKWMNVMNVLPGLGIFLSILVFLYIIKAISATIVNYLNRKLAYLVSGELSCNIFRVFMSTGFAFFISCPIGVLQNTLQREINQLGDGILSALKMATALLQVFILIYIVWSLSHNMLIICSLIALTFIIFTKRLNHSLLRFAELTTSTSNHLTQTTIEILTGAKIILAYGRGQVMLERFNRFFAEHAYFAVKSQTLQNGIPAFYQAFAILSISVSLYVSISNGENTSSLLAALWTLMRMVPLVSELVGNTAAIATVKSSFVQYMKILELAESYSIKNGDIIFSNLKDGISLSKVHFVYPQRGKALSGVDLFISKGSFTAFVGESGSGKTTTADILLKLFVPASGSVCVDSVPLCDYEITSFLDRVGYVPQESFLFNTSVRENLLWSLPTASDDDIWTSLKMANIDKFIDKLPLKLETMVGDRGVSLSGGQRQRLALARALLKKPDILIMDEATSALDTESEQLIMQSIERIAPFTTILVIAHRLSTVARADLVCVFSAGQIMEVGSYLQLSSDPKSHLGKLVAAQQLV